MTVFDERFMEDSIQKFRHELAQSRIIKTLRRVGNGIRRALLVLWWAIGRVDSFFIVSGFFVSTGIVQLVLILGDAPTSGFDIITSNNTQQLWLATGFILLGWITGYSKSMVLITISALVAAAYGFAVGIGVGTGVIDIRGLTVLVNNIFLPLAILRASWAEYQRTKYQEALASLKAAHGR